MASLSNYANKYENIKFERRSGVIQVTLHTSGKSLRWSSAIHTDLVDAFYNIGADRENKVMVLSGAGDDFCADLDLGSFNLDTSVPPESLDQIYWEGKNMLSKLLEIPCPVIAAVHGRAHIHSELLLFSDVIIADDSASFRDLHIPMGVVAGDGVHIAYPLAFGMNRGRRILLTGEIVTARQALDWGAIAEIVPPDELLPRAWELAERLSQLPILALRYSREVITREIARQLHDNLGFGLALEGFGSGLGAWPRPPGK